MSHLTIIMGLALRGIYFEVVSLQFPIHYLYVYIYIYIYGHGKLFYKQESLTASLNNLNVTVTTDKKTKQCCQKTVLESSCNSIHRVEWLLIIMQPVTNMSHKK